MSFARMSVVETCRLGLTGLSLSGHPSRRDKTVEKRPGRMMKLRASPFITSPRGRPLPKRRASSPGARAICGEDRMIL